MKIKILFLFLICLFLKIICLKAQKEVIIINENSERVISSGDNKLPGKVFNQKKLIRKIPKYVAKYHAEGYLSFSVDSLAEDSNRIYLFVYQGEKFEQLNIHVDSNELLLINEAKVSSLLNKKTIPLKNYPQLASQLIYHFENEGYPFIEVYLDSIFLENNSFNSKLVIDKHQFIYFDSIVLKGDLKLSRSFLYPYLGLRRNKKYEENLMRQIPQKIAELDFVSEVHPPGIEFLEDKCYLYLFLNKVKVNQFDGYIGMVPIDENSGKVMFNGELTLDLRNIFALGESIHLFWNTPSRYSQNLKIGLNFPFLFRTPLGVDFSFLLDKTDTTYMNMNYVVGIQYSFGGNNYLKGYFDYSSSNILSSETLVFDKDNMQYVDYKKQMYGIEFYLRKLDYLFNPRKGYVILFSGAAGKRTVLKNSNADSEIYDGIDMKSIRYRFSGQIKGFIPLHKRWVVLLAANGATLFGDRIVTNELFKIGGYNTLQGFNENEIFASSYLIGLTELRFLYAQKSYLNLFFNAAWYEKNIAGYFVTDTPFGFGIGIALNTKAGLFRLSYALGKQFDNPISLKSGKIHFGLKVSF